MPGRSFTVQSYRGRLDLGITSYLEAVPDVERLRNDLLDGWQALRRAAGTDKDVVSATA